MHISMILQYSFDVLYLNVQIPYFFVDQQTLLFRCFKIILNDLSILLDFLIAVFNHLSQVSSQLVDIIIL